MIRIAYQAQLYLKSYVKFLKIKDAKSVHGKFKIMLCELQPAAVMRLCYSRHIFNFCVVRHPLLVLPHDSRDDHKEHKSHGYDHNHWSNEGPNEAGIRIQITPT